MKNKHLLIFAVLACSALVLTLTVFAQIALVEPSSWDYGGVELGSSEPMSFLISNGNEEPLSVNALGIVDDDTGSFQVTDVSHTLPATLEAGEMMEVVVTFAPTVEAMASASLRVISDCHLNPLLYVSLQGEGVEPTPDEMMDAIMTYYDDAVADGTIYGLGNGNAPAAHLRIFLGLLDGAHDFIVDGDYDKACDLLDQADGKSDGLDAPPDFIGGPGVSSLNSMIGAIMDELDCQ